MQYFEDETKDFNEQEEAKYQKVHGKSGFEKFVALPRAAKLTIYVLILTVIFLITLLFFNIWVGTFGKLENVKSLTGEQQVYLNKILSETFPQKYSLKITELPYSIRPAKLNVWAESAIVYDFANGCVIYEKNADQIIPPASITKLFVMYLVFEEINSGKISLDDVVPLPERSWAINLPSDASKMFLGQGQTVTLRELLNGLAVASGNDAAIALASYISGGTDEFIKKMNETCKNLGLVHTHFVDTSGYDENNLTTPRELAQFIYIYMKKFGDIALQFHSMPSIFYPTEENLPSWQKNYGDSKAIFQKNTNPLLGELEGCDGIKTGFIYESGYNLALTVKRGKERFISVTMKGPGNNTKEGQAGRVHDGKEIMEWAFSSFADYVARERVKTIFTIPTPGTEEKFVNLVPAWDEIISVPHITGKTPQDTADSIEAEVSIPKYIYGGVTAGRIYGQIQYKIGKTVLQTVPLVADRNANPADNWGLFWGKLATHKLK